MGEKNNHEEKPEVYALRQDGEGWQISRRDFLKTAGIGAAVAGISMGSRFVRPASAADDLETLCRDALAHSEGLMRLYPSADGKYLLSYDKGNTLKSWEFSSHVLLESKKLDSGLIDGTVLLGGKSGALNSKTDSIQWINIPDLSTDSAGSAKVSLASNDTIRGLDTDPEGNIFVVSGQKLFKIPADGQSYGTAKLLSESSGGNSFWGVSVLAADRSLFVLLNDGFGVFDLQNSEMKEFDADHSYYAYAVLPGGARALMCSSDEPEYSLVSLTDGRKIWTKELERNILAAAVTPDGSYAFLYTKEELVMISAKDGAELHRISVKAGSQNPIAVAKDGSKLAVGVDKSILFISLPDFKVIGCPVDLKEMKDTSKGVEIKGTDPVSGQTITYTLPCGSPIPAGAVCVCNCVAGSIPTCSCDTYTCGCVGTCSCNNHTTTYSYSYHYWHPN